MENDNNSRSTWRFFDGSVSISISMLLAGAINSCAPGGQLPVLGWQGLSKVTNSGLPPQTVIPAKAGIQKAVVLRMSWIPAFAGMTD